MTAAPVCIRCGDSYLFTHSYKGNYCPDCHEAWSATPRSSGRPRATAQKSRPVTARRREESVASRDRPEPPYDEA